MRGSTLKAFKAGYLKGRQSLLTEDIATIGMMAAYTDSDGNEIWVRDEGSKTGEEFVRTNRERNNEGMYYNIETGEYDISPKNYHPSTRRDAYIRGEAGNLFTRARARLRKSGQDSDITNKGQLVNIERATKLMDKWNKDLKDALYKPTSIAQEIKGNNPDAQRWFDYEFLLMYADLTRLIDTARSGNPEYNANAAKVFNAFKNQSDEVAEFATKIESINVNTSPEGHADEAALSRAEAEYEDHAEAAYDICQHVMLGSNSYKKYLEIGTILAKGLGKISEKNPPRKAVVNSVFNRGTKGSFPIMLGEFTYDPENRDENPVRIKNRDKQFDTNTEQQQVFYDLRKDGFKDSHLSTIPFGALKLVTQKGNKKTLVDYRWDNLDGYNDPKYASTYGTFVRTDNDAKVRYTIMLAYSVLSYTDRDKIIQLMQEILDDLRECFHDRAVLDRLDKYVDRVNASSESLSEFTDD